MGKRILLGGAKEKKALRCVREGTWAMLTRKRLEGAEEEYPGRCRRGVLDDANVYVPVGSCRKGFFDVNEKVTLLRGQIYVFSTSMRSIL